MKNLLISFTLLASISTFADSSSTLVKAMDKSELKRDLKAYDSSISYEAAVGKSMVILSDINLSYSIGANKRPVNKMLEVLGSHAGDIAKSICEKAGLKRVISYKTGTRRRLDRVSSFDDAKVISYVKMNGENSLEVNRVLAGEIRRIESNEDYMKTFYRIKCGLDRENTESSEVEVEALDLSI